MGIHGYCIIASALMLNMERNDHRSQNAVQVLQPSIFIYFERDPYCAFSRPHLVSRYGAS